MSTLDKFRYPLVEAFKSYLENGERENLGIDFNDGFDYILVHSGGSSGHDNILFTHWCERPNDVFVFDNKSEILYLESDEPHAIPYEMFMGFIEMSGFGMSPNLTSFNMPPLLKSMVK